MLSFGSVGSLGGRTRVSLGGRWQVDDRMRGAVDRPDREGGALDRRDQHLGAGRDGRAGPADRQPALADELHVPDLVGIADDVEGDDLLADQAAVDAAAETAVVAAVHGLAD